MKEALAGPEALLWMEAMEKEQEALVSMRAWDLTSLPAHRSAIPCKWVFKRKLNPDGSIERYKARLVIVGFRQRYGIDYSDVFAPVVRAATIRWFFSLVASADLECHSIDIKNAFILSDLDEEIYMTQPTGFADGSSDVCRLRKSLYGLKQAPRAWNQTLTKHLLSLGCVQCLSDGALFVLSSEDLGEVIILLFVDDIVIASDALPSVEIVKDRILSKFPGTDQGPTTFFLQMTVERNRSKRTLVLKQRRHIEKLLEENGLSESNPLSLPLPVNHQNSPLGDELEPDAVTEYKSIIGALMHISSYTRPDISYGVNYLARFTAKPHAVHISQVRNLLRYLKGTVSYGLLLGGPSVDLRGFCDADWAACPVTRRSTTGFVVMAGLGAISWKSVRQKTVSRSSTESEYIAAGEIAKEVQHLYQLVGECGVESDCVPIGIDNQAAKGLIEDPLSASRTKHIDIVHHHVRERVAMGWMEFEKIGTLDNVSDIFTKALPVTLFEKHRTSLGVRSSGVRGCVESA